MRLCYRNINNIKVIIKQSLSNIDDGGEGNNFYITYNLEAGKTYRLAVRWYGSDRVGYMAIILDKA